MNRPSAVTAVIVLGLLLRIGVSVWNGLAGPSLGANADARNFHQFAVAVSEGRSAPGADLTAFSYAYALGEVYKVFGASLLLGSLLSCIAWLASALVLRSSLRLLQVSNVSQFAGQTVYALLPSSVLWTSVTLREPYQLLCVNVMMHAALRILTRPSFGAFLWLIAGAGLGALLHGTLLVFAAAVIGTLLTVGLGRLARSRVARLGLVGGTALVLIVGAAAAFQWAYPRYDFSGGPAAALQKHLETGMVLASRTAYIHDTTVRGNGDLAWLVPIGFAKYLFEPMPWRITRWLDLGFIAENLVRALLIGLGVAALWRLRGVERQRVAMVLIWYLTLEFVWSVGTFNWGTAARHHIPAIGLLLTAALAYRPGLPQLPAGRITPDRGDRQTT